MPYTISCPNCQQQMQMNDNAAGQQFRLDSLLLLHPSIDRDADPIGHGEDLVGAEADRPPSSSLYFFTTA